jgi:hypothetical protein
VKLNKTKEKWRQLLFDAGKRITTLAKDTLNQAKQEKVQQEEKDKEAATSSVSALQESPEAAESPVNETSEPESAPGGNGRRAPRKTAKPGTEEQHLEVPPGAVLTGAEEAVPPLEQAV